MVWLLPTVLRLLELLLLSAVVWGITGPAFDPSAQDSSLVDMSGAVSYSRRAACQLADSSCNSVYTYTISPASPSVADFYFKGNGATSNQTICKTISFVFTSLSLHAAELTISDVSPANTFFACASCSNLLNPTDPQTSIMPPLFNSTSGSVRIKIFGTGVTPAGNSADSSFTLQYFCNVVYTTNAQASDARLAPLRDIKLDINSGYGTIRPLLSSFFEFQSAQPRITLKLPAGTTQRFHIAYAASTLSGANIHFAVTMLVNTCASSNTVFQIYARTDGNYVQMGKPIYDPCNPSWTGGRSPSWSPKRWISSSTGEALVFLQNKGSTDVQIYFEVSFYVDMDLYDCGELLRPNALIADSWILTDGSKSSTSQRTIMSATSCQWLIAPYTQSPVTLIYSWVSLKQGSRVVVYDNNQASGPVLWDSGQTHSLGSFSGESYTTPPPIISSGNSLYVVYNTDPRGAGHTYLGFAGEYVGNTPNSIGFGDSKATLSMCSAIDISPPGNGTMYASSLVYTWAVSPIAIINYATVDVGPITFVLSALSLPPGDSLTIYDSLVPSPSTVLQVFSGQQLPAQWFKTSSSKASMVFRSSSRSNAGAPIAGTVKVSYFTDGPNYHCGFTRNPAVLTATSMTLTDGSYSNETSYRSQLCQWTLAPQGARGIFLSFNRYSLFGGSISVYDGPVATGNLVAIITDTAAVPAPIFLPSSPIMGVAYSSGAAVSGFGFSATYFGVQAGTAAMPGDGVIRLYSSSMQSLTYASVDNFLFNTTFTYLVRPTGSRGSIYFSLSSLNLSATGNCNLTRLVIFDGDQTAVNLTALSLQFYANATLSHNANGTRLNYTYPDFHLASFCRNQLPTHWIKTKSGTATILFSSSAPSPQQHRASFDLSYFSDGPSSHCGFPSNPGMLTADSMVFTDGSSSRERLYPGSDCEFVIAPRHVSPSGLVVLEFLSSDLQGATLEVHEGRAAGIHTLRWRCDSCVVVPRPIISRAGSFFVRFTSSSSSSRSSNATTSRGAGFKAIYWTLNSTAPGTPTSTETLLELPLHYRFSNSINNHTTYLSLPVDELPSKLSFSPYYRVMATVNITSRVRDGRPGNSNFDSLTGPVGTCGLWTSSALGPPGLGNVNNSIFMASTQSAAYLSSSIGSKRVYVNAAGATAGSDGPLASAPVCKYKIDSGSSQSVLITIASFDPGAGGGRLRVFGQVVPYQLLGNDAVLYDSAASPVPATPLVAWCGVATIVLEGGPSAATAPTHALQLSYQINPLDTGFVCLDYKLSLLPKVVKPDPLIPLYIALGALGACCLSFVAFYHLRRYLRKHWPEGGIVGVCYQRLRTYQVVTPRHLRYTPRLDEIRNRFLPQGQCCICQEDKVPVFYMDCNHALCMEDIKGYLTSALGDISMFPVKCPLHYEGCAGKIEACLAKRVLSRVMFDKFNEFSDRAVYGEGMRCIFCDNFVNFPVEGTRSMVECPYCVQRFCMRCRKSWHFGSRCPLDKVDDSLDAWRAESMAQKCPCCHKLIEKDDPDTCNHMVHKVTDGIPCLRDRTDFCYLCGDEVTPDYPHEEAKNPGVNHFPDGVFQKCRKVAQRERDSERDRLRKLRRMKGKRPTDRAVGFGYGVLGADENNPEYDGFEEEAHKDNYGHAGGAEDRFDEQWSTALRAAPKRASPSPAGPATGSPIATAARRASAVTPSTPSPTRGISAGPGTSRISPIG